MKAAKLFVIKHIQAKWRSSYPKGISPRTAVKGNRCLLCIPSSKSEIHSRGHTRLALRPKYGTLKVLGLRDPPLFRGSSKTSRKGSIFLSPPFYCFSQQKSLTQKAMKIIFPARQRLSIQMKIKNKLFLKFNFLTFSANNNLKLERNLTE